MTFVPRPGLEAALLRSSSVKSHLDTLARRGAELYAASVPVDEGGVRDGVFGDVALTPDGYKGRIGSTDWKAGLVEFGTIEHAPDASLRRAIDSLGMKLEDGPDA